MQQAFIFFIPGIQVFIWATGQTHTVGGGSAFRRQVLPLNREDNVPIRNRMMTRAVPIKTKQQDAKCVREPGLKLQPQIKKCTPTCQSDSQNRSSRTPLRQGNTETRAPKAVSMVPGAPQPLLAEIFSPRFAGPSVTSSWIWLLQ